MSEKSETNTSRRDFLKVKRINFCVGLLLGFIGYVFGW